MIDQSVYKYRIMDSNSICVANFERYDIACAIRDKYVPKCLIQTI